MQEPCTPTKQSEDELFKNPLKYNSVGSILTFYRKKLRHESHDNQSLPDNVSESRKTSSVINRIEKLRISNEISDERNKILNGFEENLKQGQDECFGNCKSISSDFKSCKDKSSNKSDILQVENSQISTNYPSVKGDDQSIDLINVHKDEANFSASKEIVSVSCTDSNSCVARINEIVVTDLHNSFEHLEKAAFDAECVSDSRKEILLGYTATEVDVANVKKELVEDITAGMEARECRHGLEQQNVAPSDGFSTAAVVRRYKESTTDFNQETTSGLHKYPDQQNASAIKHQASTDIHDLQDQQRFQSRNPEQNSTGSFIKYYKSRNSDSAKLRNLYDLPTRSTYDHSFPGDMQIDSHGFPYERQIYNQGFQVQRQIKKQADDSAIDVPSTARYVNVQTAECPLNKSSISSYRTSGKNTTHHHSISDRIRKPTTARCTGNYKDKNINALQTNKIVAELPNNAQLWSKSDHENVVKSTASIVEYYKQTTNELVEGNSKMLLESNSNCTMWPQPGKAFQRISDRVRTDILPDEVIASTGGFLNPYRQENVATTWQWGENYFRSAFHQPQPEMNDNTAETNIRNSISGFLNYYNQKTVAQAREMAVNTSQYNIHYHRRNCSSRPTESRTKDGYSDANIFKSMMGSLDYHKLEGTNPTTSNWKSFELDPDSKNHTVSDTTMFNSTVSFINSYKQKNINPVCGPAILDSRCSTRGSRLTSVDVDPKPNALDSTPALLNNYKKKKMDKTNDSTTKDSKFISSDKRSSVDDNVPNPNILHSTAIFLNTYKQKVLDETNDSTVKYSNFILSNASTGKDSNSISSEPMASEDNDVPKPNVLNSTANFLNNYKQKLLNPANASTEKDSNSISSETLASEDNDVPKPNFLNSTANFLNNYKQKLLNPTNALIRKDSNSVSSEQSASIGNDDLEPNCLLSTAKFLSDYKQSKVNVATESAISDSQLTGNEDETGQETDDYYSYYASCSKVDVIERTWKDDDPITKLILVREMYDVDADPVSILQDSVELSQMTVRYEETDGTECSVYVNDELITTQTGSTPNALKSMAASAALHTLAKKCCLLQVLKTHLSTKTVTMEDLDRQDEDSESQISECFSSSSVATNMLKKMGWTGGGLGKDGSGIVEPIAVELKKGRKGLGIRTKRPMAKSKLEDGISGKSQPQKKGRFVHTPEFTEKVSRVLEEFLAGLETGTGEPDLVFVGFGRRQRLAVHRITQEVFDLMTKSYGSGINRYLVIRPLETMEDVYFSVIYGEASPEKYRLLGPGDYSPEVFGKPPP